MSFSVEFPENLLPDFRIKVKSDGTRVAATCSGTLDAPDAVAKLQPELLRFHDALQNAKVKQVRLEMQAVDYMNSSGIKCFMFWFLKAEKSKDHYTIEVVYDPNRTWQYVSFSTMGKVAPKTLRMVSITEA